MNSAAVPPDLYADCSDEELYNPDKCEDAHIWQPRASEIAQLYEALDQGRVPVLRWQCPGRKKPVQITAIAEPDAIQQRPDVSTEEPQKARILEEFEKDETVTEKSVSNIRVSVSKPVRLQKKVATFDAIYQDVLQQKKAEMSDKDHH